MREPDQPHHTLDDDALAHVAGGITYSCTAPAAVRAGAQCSFGESYCLACPFRLPAA